MCHVSLRHLEPRVHCELWQVIMVARVVILLAVIFLIHGGFDFQSSSAHIQILLQQVTLDMSVCPPFSLDQLFLQFSSHGRLIAPQSPGATTRSLT